MLCWEGVVPVPSCILLVYWHREAMKWLHADPSGAEVREQGLA